MILKSVPLLKSLRGRYLIVLLVLTAVPTLLIGILAYRNARQTIEARVEAQLTSIADLKKEQINGWVERTSSDVRLLADNFLNEEHFTVITNPDADPQLKDSFAGFITENLISHQQVRNGYSEILFVDSLGEIILSTSPSNVGLNFSWHPAVASTLNSPTGAYIQDIHRAEDTGEIEMVFGHVLHRVDVTTMDMLPEVNGAILIRVRMDESIYPLVHAWPGMGTSGETLLARVEGNGLIFLNPLRFDDNAALNLRVSKDSPDAKPAFLGSTGQEGIITTPDYRGIEVLAAYRHIPEIGWGFVAKQDVGEAFESVTGLTRLWIWITIVVLLIAVGAGILLTRTLTQPLDRLVSAAQDVAAGNLDARITVRRSDEIGALAESFRTMISAVRERNAELLAHGEELEALFNLSSQFLGTLDISDILDSALRETFSGTNTEAGAIMLYNPISTEMVVRSISGSPN